MSSVIYDSLKQLDAFVISVEPLCKNIIKLDLFAPSAARNFQPGQFFRLQSYKGSKAYPMKAIALTGVYTKGDILTLIINKVGDATSKCSFFEKGEKVSLMGPVGQPTFIPKNQTVLLIGGGVRNASLFSVAKKMKENSCYVYYFSGYKTLNEKCYDEWIKESADYVVWCVDKLGLFTNKKPEEKIFEGNLVDALLKHKEILNTIDYVLVSGSCALMKAVSNLCMLLSETFKKSCLKIASLNNPMQCMMKEVCGKCIQKHYDFIAKKDIFVYTCVAQDQSLNNVDFDFLEKKYLIY
jgi:NAD(P)H-flavin reductase